MTFIQDGDAPEHWTLSYDKSQWRTPYERAHLPAIAACAFGLACIAVPTMMMHLILPIFASFLSLGWALFRMVTRGTTKLEMSGNHIWIRRPLTGFIMSAGLNQLEELDLFENGSFLICTVRFRGGAVAEIVSATPPHDALIACVHKMGEMAKIEISPIQ